MFISPPSASARSGAKAIVVRHAWKISAVETLEAGPERCVLGVKMVGGASELELRLTLWRDRAALDAGVRVLWNERSARLQLVLRGVGSEAEYEVPGGTATWKLPPTGKAARVDAAEQRVIA